MTDQSRKPAANGTSGEHIAVRTFRAKLDSIADSTLPLTKALNARIDRATKRSGRPVDNRREPPSDPRIEDEIPVDVVEDEERERKSKEKASR